MGIMYSEQAFFTGDTIISASLSIMCVINLFPTMGAQAAQNRDVIDFND